MNIKKTFAIILILTLGIKSLMAQKLYDSSVMKMSRTELADFFYKKGSSRQGTGFLLMGVGTAAIIGGAVIWGSDLFGGGGSGGVVLFLAGSVTFGISHGLLAKGSNFKGRAEMLRLDPYRQGQQLEIEKYRRQVTTNTILAWTCITGGILLPMLTGSAVPMLALYAAAPFFMGAGRNKGRLAVLMGTEKIASGSMNGEILRSLGFAIPLGK